MHRGMAQEDEGLTGNVSGWVSVLVGLGLGLTIGGIHVGEYILRYRMYREESGFISYRYEIHKARKDTFRLFLVFYQLQTTAH